jgi:hypothetical protein
VPTARQARRTIGPQLQQPRHVWSMTTLPQTHRLVCTSRPTEVSRSPSKAVPSQRGGQNRPSGPRTRAVADRGLERGRGTRPRWWATGPPARPPTSRSSGRGNHRACRAWGRPERPARECPERVRPGPTRGWARTRGRRRHAPRGRRRPRRTDRHRPQSPATPPRDAHPRDTRAASGGRRRPHTTRLRPQARSIDGFRTDA